MLRTDVGDLALASPLLTGSGTFGHDLSALQFASPTRFGAHVLKTVTVEPRQGNAPPRMVETPAGLMNSIGLENRGIDAFLAEVVPRLADSPIPVVASAGGKAAADFAKVCAAFESCPSVAAIELNLSCPNVAGGKLPFATSPEAIAEVVGACRSTTAKPIWAKLSPNVTRIAPLAQAAESAGADALTVANTLLGLAIDWRTRRPALGAGFGGLSGPAIHPVALRLVHECRKAVSLPIVASGGASDAESVLQFLVAGASAVQLGTALFREPDLASPLAEELERLLTQEGATVADLIGTLKWPVGES